MTLAEISKQIHDAKAAHKAWEAKAEALVASIPLEKDQVPLLPTDCIFGKWYYGDGQNLRKLPAHSALEFPHDKLHQTYMQIFKLLFDEPDVSSLGRLFGKHKKIKRQHIEQAKALLPTLRKCSASVCESLDQLEDQIASSVKRHAASQKTNTFLDGTVE